MKQVVLIGCVLFFLFFSAEGQDTRAPKKYKSESVRGDFDGDGKNELVWIEDRQLDTLQCVIVSSNKNIPDLIIAWHPKTQPSHAGDYNKDGVYDLSVDYPVPDRENVWQHYKSYTAKGRKWREFTSDEFQDFPFTSKSAKGDFNGDGKHEYIRLHVTLADSNLVCKVICSDRHIPTIPIGQCVEGRVLNEGDLDGDGIAELSVIREGDADYWMTMETYTFKNGRWKMLFDSFTIYGYAGWHSRVEKHPTKTGHLLIQENTMHPDKPESRTIRLK